MNRIGENVTKLTCLMNSLYIETILLLCMFFSLAVAPILCPISLWIEIPPLLFVRAIVWLLGVCVLPGLCVLRLTRITENASKLVEIALAVNLSFILVGLLSLTLYYVQGSATLLPWLVLVTLTILTAIRWIRSIDGKRTSDLKLKFSKWDFLLALSLLASGLIALAVQIGQQYLIPGDLWVSLQPAVEMLSGRDVFAAFGGQEYPIMYGFTLSGLSTCFGMPIVNTYVFLFPLVALNILSFYAVVTEVFRKSREVGILASVLYGFTGGLGYIFQILVYNGTLGFWSVSHLTYDMYFTVSFWNNVEFSYKSLALTLTYSSLVMFALSLRIRNYLRSSVGLLMASSLLLFSFLIHIVEPLLLFPVILALALLREDRWLRRLRNLGVFILGSVSVFLLVEFLTQNYYSWLIITKTGPLLATLDIGNVSSAALLLIPIGTVYSPTLFKKLKGPRNRKNVTKSFKKLVVILLAAIYLAGLYFWLNAPASEKPLYDVNQFPWYYNTTRYGFVGFLALVGIGIAGWKTKSFLIAIVWCLVPLLLGSFWWGYRVTSYIQPIVALFAAIGLIYVWRRSSLHFCAYLTRQDLATPEKVFRVRLKPVICLATAALLVLSSSSVIYGAAFYAANGPCLNADDIETLLWLNKNTPEDAAVLVPNVYKLSKGVETIADRRVHIDANLPTGIDADSFTSLVETFYSHDLQYAVTSGDSCQNSYLMGVLLKHSSLTFESGQYEIHKLPELNPPSHQSSIVVVDKEKLGLSNISTNFAWLDDAFTKDWTYKNVNATADGELLTYEWCFKTNSTQEPSMKTRIAPVDTDLYPYLIISYRNTPETTLTADSNIAQIITLVNSTGYPNGFIKNIYVPVKKEKAFQILVTELPRNQNIAEIWIWMRNPKKLDGRIRLQIDYVGVSSTEDVQDAPTNLRFLTMAIPALWPTGYTITSNLTEARKASVLVTMYDKSVSSYADNQSDINTFVLINTTAATPTWGTQWKTEQQGILCGKLEGRTFLIVGINETLNANHEGLPELALLIHENIGSSNG